MLTEDVYWIWFQLLFGIGTPRAELMLNYFGHPRKIYEGVVGKTQVQRMLKARELAESDSAMEQARDIRQRTLGKGCDIVTPDHPAYPRLLRGINSPPAALYVKGDLSCLANTLAIAMVGTRHHTDYGQKAAMYLAGGLARQGVVVVSGLAPGIDTDSHAGALEAGGKTIGVLGCGIDIAYPKDSRKIKRAMSQNGAVVTEFPLGVTPYPSHFPLRNRIISGMSHGTVVVEADLRSGSLITARLAIEQGRELFAVPCSIFAREEQGTHKLLKEGAQLAERPEDILSRFGKISQKASLPAEKIPAPLFREDPVKPQTPEPSVKREARSIPEGVTEEGRAVYACFGAEKLAVDDLAGLTKLPPGELLSALTELEIYGLIQSYPGRKFGLQ